MWADPDDPLSVQTELGSGNTHGGTPFYRGQLLSRGGRAHDHDEQDGEDGALSHWFPLKLSRPTCAGPVKGVSRGCMMYRETLPRIDFLDTDLTSKIPSIRIAHQTIRAQTINPRQYFRFSFSGYRRELRISTPRESAWLRSRSPRPDSLTADSEPKVITASVTICTSTR